MPTNITDVSTFTDPVVAPADGDNLDAASIVPGTIQALANRTRLLANRTTGITGAGEFLYDSSKLRTRIIHPSSMMQGSLAVAATQFWSIAQFVSGGTGYSLTSQADSAVLIDDIGRYLPVGCTLTGVDVLVAPGLARAPGARMVMTLQLQTPDFSSPAIPPATGPIFSVEDDGSTTVQVLSSGAIAQNPLRTQTMTLRIVAGNTGGTNKDDVHAIRLTFLAGGPNAF